MRIGLLALIILIFLIIHTCIRREQLFNTIPDSIVSFDALDVPVPLNNYNDSLIKSGDLYLARDLNSSFIKKVLWASYMTHVAIFHRCIYTGRLFVFEFGGSSGALTYELWDKKKYTYHGNLYLSPLIDPLSMQQLQQFQSIIDNIYDFENKNLNYFTLSRKAKLVPTTPGESTNQTKSIDAFIFPMTPRSETSALEIESISDYDIIATCGLNCIFPTIRSKNISTAKGIVCTDLTQAIYHKLGLIPATDLQVCLVPKWFHTNPSFIKYFNSSIFILRDETRIISVKSDPNSTYEIDANGFTE